jgi:hypothetical protein
MMLWHGQSHGKNKIEAQRRQPKEIQRPGNQMRLARFYTRAAQHRVQRGTKVSESFRHPALAQYHPREGSPVKIRSWIKISCESETASRRFSATGPALIGHHRISFQKNPAAQAQLGIE